MQIIFYELEFNVSPLSYLHSVIAGSNNIQHATYHSLFIHMRIGISFEFRS